MGASILSIGVTGLNAAQANLAVTGQNITNASTPGYTRQQIVQSANEPMFTGSGFFGQGVNIDTVRRVYNEYLTAQVLNAQTNVSAMASYQQQIDQISNLVADSNAGMGPAFTGFFSSLNQLSANPASTSSRQAFLSDAQTLVARFHDMNERFDQISSQVNTQIASEVAAINTYARQIADVNERIIVAQSAGQGQSPNDLMDLRDTLINELNQKIRVTVLPQDDGGYNLFIGTGQPLLVGNTVSTLVSKPDEHDPLRTNVAMLLPGGSSMELPDRLLTGGALGGLIAFRNESLNSVQNELGRIAIVLAQSFNDQHRLGQDLQGEMGKDFFSISSPRVLPNPLNPLPQVNVDVSFDDVGQLKASDYQLVSNGGGNYTLTRLSDNVVLVDNAMLPASIDGLKIVPSAPAPAGASYLLQPVRAGARDIAVALDNTNDIALAAPVRTAASLTNTGNAKISAGQVEPGFAPLMAGITLTYDGAGNLSGFPVGAQVSVGGGAPVTIAALTDLLPYANGATISFNGMNFQITGTPDGGDTFSITANSSGVSDNRNALLLGQLQTARLLNGGTASLQDSYASMVNQIGNKARAVQVNRAAQESLLEQSQRARDSVSSVNLDEEAANLLRFQQAYQAAARLISVSEKLFESLLSL
ncbi:MAG: flagellar hook-associated protein FlgK [Sterolibacterium sp.]|nr:flagellar hook-associated protein FlgK [Sterolibacterium sp.]